MTQTRKQRKPRKPRQKKEQEQPKKEKDNIEAILKKIEELEKKISQKQVRPISYKLPPPPKDTAQIRQLESEIKELQKRLPIGVSTTDPRAMLDFNTLRQFAERQSQSSTVDYLSQLQATQQEKEQKAIDKLLEDTYKTDIEARDKRKTEILQAKAKGNQEEFYDLISMVSREHKARDRIPSSSPFMSRSPSLDSIDEFSSSSSAIGALLEARATKARTERPSF